MVNPRLDRLILSSNSARISGLKVRTAYNHDHYLLGELMKNISLIILFLAVCVTGNADLKDPALAIYYSFDDIKGTIIKDGSTSGNDGEIVGNAKFEKGQNGQAIELKESVWIKINGAEFKNFPIDGFSLVTWVNHEDSGEPQSLFDAIGDKHGNGLFHVEIRPAGFRFFHRNDAQQEVFNINPGPVIKGKKWHHFAGTYDAKSRVVATYVDGKKTHEAKAAKGVLATNWKVTAGIGHHKNGRWYKGLLDEFFLFGKAVTPQEIKEIMDGDFLAVKPLGKLPIAWGAIKSNQ